MEFANANKVYDLTPIPAQLDTLVGQVAPRFVLEYANANREIGLVFPIDLIDDNTPPRGSTIEIEPAEETSTTISWTTNEYADSTVECGTQSGTYTMTFSDTLYVKMHTVTLTGLTPETTYYCRVISTDPSGNIYHSQEFSFEQFAQPAATITKHVSPEGQVEYGDELTYTLVISGVPGTEVGVYDPLTDTTFIRFTEQPTGIESANQVITGATVITPTNQTTVSFVVQVGVPETVGFYVDVNNSACVYPTRKTISSCVWSNTVTNQASRPRTIFLPLVVRDQ